MRHLAYWVTNAVILSVCTPPMYAADGWKFWTLLVWSTAIPFVFMWANRIKP